MAIEKHTKSAVSKNVPSLSAIFMKAFDLRRTLVSGIVSGSREVFGFTPNLLEEMEMTINKLALKFIYKLPTALLGLITGLLPVVLLSLLMSLLPPFLRCK